MAALHPPPTLRHWVLSSSSSESAAARQPLITCSSTTTAPLTIPGAPASLPAARSTPRTIQCPPLAPPRQQGDWNSLMLFNRGLDTVKSVDKEMLWDAVDAAGDKPVVLDLYSKWCRPCQLIYSKLVQLSDEYKDVVFMKLDCSAENKSVFSKLGIGILPTFKIFKNNSSVSEVKGAKYKQLVSKIERARCSS